MDGLYLYCLIYFFIDHSSTLYTSLLNIHIAISIDLYIKKKVIWFIKNSFFFYLNKIIIIHSISLLVAFKSVLDLPNVTRIAASNLKLHQLVSWN